MNGSDLSVCSGKKGEQSANLEQKWIICGTEQCFPAGLGTKILVTVNAEISVCVAHFDSS